MSLSLLFHILVPGLLLLTHAHSACIPFFDVVLSEQRRYLVYQQRGLSRELTKPFYETFLKDIDHFAQKKFPRTSVKDICLTDSQITKFYKKFHDKTAIDEDIKFLIVRFPHIPYLKESQQPNVPIDDRFEEASTTYFKTTEKYLVKHKPSKAAALPRTSHVFYDPGRQNVLFTYFLHAAHGPKMKASKLLAKVTALVITLEFMKVPRSRSVQMLRHTVAWLSTVFRALQDDGPDVVVPVQFLPFYKRTFRVLRREGNFDLEKVKKKIVEEEFGDLLEVYTRLDTWGRLEVIRWEDKGSLWSIEEDLFDPVVLKRIAEKIGFEQFDPADHPRYDPDVDSVDGWEMEVDRKGSYSSNEEVVDPFDNAHLLSEVNRMRNSSRAQSIGNRSVKASKKRRVRRMRKGVRIADMCETPLYEYWPRTVSTWEESCCASICCNSMLMLEAGLSTEACCGDCNQLECTIEGSGLEGLAMVHLEPYGCDEGGAVPVSL